MATSFGAKVGAIGGAITVLVLLTFLLCFLFSKLRQSPNKDSETGSSDHPSGAETKRQEARQFRVDELEQATRQFNETNLIGVGTFGLVFKGLLGDGTVVAIKRRTGLPRQDFIEEVAYLSAIQHRNLVTLLGYCQETECQMLVFEYLPNGSVCSHLYDTGKDSTTKLEFKQRLAIAIGAAKGLSHLHCLQPPLIHSNFKTSNVLVDENFIAKVADAGLSKLLAKIGDKPSSSSSPSTAFKDPELGRHDSFLETSDVYSFGVFLLELISGKEATYEEAFRTNDGLLHWVQEHLTLDELIDERLTGIFTEEGTRDLIRLMVKCMRFPGRERPRMGEVVMELDQILENEITRTTVMGEGTASVTLGSQLFMN